MEKIYIYTLSDPFTNEIRYVGKTNDINKRLVDHCKKCNLKNNSYKNNWIELLLSKNKKPKIEILDEVFDDEWQFLEKYWIEQLKQWGFNLTNMTSGGEGKDNYICPIETKNKISKSLSGQNHPNWGKKLSDTTKIKISMGNMGKKVSSETKNKLSNSKKGKKLSDEHKNKLSKTLIGNKRRLGIKHTEETKKKLSIANKGKGIGKIVSNETRKKLSDKRKGIPSPTRRKVSINNQIFDSISDASTKLNIKLTTLLYRLNSKNNKFKNYVFI